MKKMRVLLSMAMCIPLLWGCSRSGDTKQTYMREFTRCMENIRQHYDRCDSSACAAMDVAYVQLSEQKYLLYQQELTVAEQQQIDRWYWDYQQAIVRRKATLLGRKLKRYYQETNATVKKYINP